MVGAPAGAADRGISAEGGVMKKKIDHWRKIKALVKQEGGVSVEFTVTWYTKNLSRRSWVTGATPSQVEEILRSRARKVGL